MQLNLLVTPYQNRKLPVYKWYNYNHSFSRGLVTQIIESLSLKSKDKILDPFCGTGTTLLASREKGIPAVGIDILPLSVFISSAKVRNYDQTLIKEKTCEIQSLLSKKSDVKLLDDTLTKYFPEKVLKNIFLVDRWCENSCCEETKYFFLTAMMSILEKVSYTRKDGGFLRILPQKIVPDFNPLFFAKLEDMMVDLDFLNALPAVKVISLEGDARQLNFADNTFSAVITSPPYLNRHDYTRVYLLELLVSLVKSQESLKNLRYKTLCSHVEAKRMFSVDNYKPPGTLEALLKKLKTRALPNKQVLRMIENYFEDMYLVLKECQRVIRQGGNATFVIGNVRYGGIKIPVGEILIDIGDEVGLKLKEKTVARLRGNSPQQMGKYGREPVEEYVITWEKK